MQKVETISLFDQSEYIGTLFEPTPGFRLEKLEVLNWGTFDKKVWNFSPHGETALLTGDVGSGKSTLVDALITLLMPPRKAAFNKAADASARERTLATYIKGYYGQKRSDEGTGRPETLRDINHYSVLLATFHDKGLNQFVTLVQFFWFQDTQMNPARFYVVADRNLDIEKDFTNFDKGVRILKKRLKQDDSVQVFEDYTRYASAFRRKFGNMQEQALDLFQQTISMKKVELLTDFVRSNMLEPPTTNDDVDKLIRHFHDLNTAHEAVIKAKNQIEHLTPLVETGERYEKVEKEREQFEHARNALPSWFASQVLILLDNEIIRCERALEVTGAKLKQAESELGRIDDAIKSTQREIYNNGGNALEMLKQDFHNAKQALEKIREKRTSYRIYADELELPLPKTIAAFTKNINALPELKSNEQQKLEQLSDRYTNAAISEKSIEQEIDSVMAELEFLKSRKSNIPRNNAEKRKQLCEALKIAEEELPFVGELIEVRENELRWEGAIERLLHNFGLSLLVPDEHYKAVAKWVDETSLGMRLVYYRVRLDDADHRAMQISEQSVSKKLNIKPNTPFGIWLNKELSHRFPHVCCEDMNQFYRETQAITQAGQIKAKGNRHEKDDRYNINDRKRFILGFSNQKKVAALEENESKLNAQLKSCKDEIEKVRSGQKSSQSRINALGELERINDFAEIDTISKRNEIDGIKKRIDILEQENDILKALEDQLSGLENQWDAQNKERDKLLGNKANMEERIKSLHKRKEDNENMTGELTHEARELIFAVLEQQKSKALGNSALSLDNENRLEKNYTSWLAEIISKLSKDSTKLSNTTVEKMTRYRNEYPEHTAEVDSSLDSLPEYKKMLVQLEEDGLPRFEERFKKLLRENTINQIALFQAKLKHEQDTIKERIGQINNSLSTIDYNEGRYIRLEYEDSRDFEIKAFQVQLKACTDGALTGSDDSQYAEAKFLQVKEIIERFKGRPGETESDIRWTNKVVDVRNWFLFAASERWRETDEEYEHYKDSSGKSGGQKEKLAYTILAASLVYHFGLNRSAGKEQSFRFVVIDEAFLKSSDESARFGLELFKKLDLQLLIVTPLLKIPTIEPYISHVGFVHHDDVTHQSMLRNISIEEYRREKKNREGASDA